MGAPGPSDQMLRSAAQRVLPRLQRNVACMSTWTDVPQAPLDPILGMGQRFQADTDPRKVNVSVGAYRTDEGKPLVLSCIKKAEARLLSDASLNKLCQTMLFGDDSKLVKDGLLATAQTLSGTGAL